MLNQAQLNNMLSMLQVSRMLKNVNQSKVVYSNLQEVDAKKFCKHNCITIKQLKDLEPDYLNLKLLISSN